MSLSPNRRIARTAAIVFLSDQATKWLVLRHLDYSQEKTIIPGFFKFIHVGNTGAAWSLFTGNNSLLAIVALVALVALYLTRHHFGARTTLGQLALGLIFGGILGNLFDRVLPDRRQVIDFIYFFINRADGRELGFPAFNIADSAICLGVGLVFLLNWKKEVPSATNEGEPTTTP
jgi:signal peptidase II